MNWYKIMQEAGERAKRSRRAPWEYARPRKVGEVQSTNQLDALQEFVFQKYIRTSNKQYAGYESFVRNARRFDSAWRLWDNPDGSKDPHDNNREWSVVVTLRNGPRNVHTIRLLAWKEEDVKEGSIEPGSEWVEVEGETLLLTTEEADEWLERALKEENDATR